MGTPTGEILHLARARKQHLWTADRRRRHGLDAQDDCWLCDQEHAETADHLLANCCFAKELWWSVLSWMSGWTALALFRNLCSFTLGGITSGGCRSRKDGEVWTHLSCSSSGLCGKSVMPVTLIATPLVCMRSKCRSRLTSSSGSVQAPHALVV